MPRIAALGPDQNNHAAGERPDRDDADLAIVPPVIDPVVCVAFKHFGGRREIQPAFAQRRFALDRIERYPEQLNVSTK